ncbi:hypothetical protein A3L04_07110 [Thermococcus chitonophagus]|uniref:Endonuclease GajA/Old nuclease/RecF-like AAA domain-containing protein n=1 Tax=Thermococcus chitonophagus TaxID=54262 RepID=A0A160VUN3_9EURY|nr:AAA family ATPase [Thermococcus chitonophagus]ASJ16857.1 hypothetical protein A3L04_07110 [Thermococcus chitonophagus]CUX78336.1 hypothetical protein CHITON_1557 [Thermococcus chitonophagus]
MIRELEIENFKSIKKLDLDCKIISIFIGEPKVGKSNTLEAIWASQEWERAARNNKPQPHSIF